MLTHRSSYIDGRGKASLSPPLGGDKPLCDVAPFDRRGKMLKTTPWLKAKNAPPVMISGSQKNSLMRTLRFPVIF